MSSQTTPLNAPAANKNPLSFSTKNNATWNGRPLWQWWLGGGVASLVVIALVLYLISPSTQRFDLIVINAPPESDVYVDDVKSGIPMADGRIRIPNLKSGDHRVRCSAQEKDNQRVDLKLREQEYKCSPAEKPPPPQITYGGSVMVLVEGGPFPMGDNISAHNNPQRVVDVPAFYIDKFEVTNDQFRSYCASKSNCPKYYVPTYFDNDAQSPVLSISYEEAEAYAREVGKFLPTNEQWEKAASWGRGWKIGERTKRKFPWGETPIPDVRLGQSGRRTPFPVNPASKDISEYGVVDMAGNAPEWVGGNKEERATRGGNWTEPPESFEITRISLAPDKISGYQKPYWANTVRCVVPVSNPQLQAFLREKGFIN